MTTFAAVVAGLLGLAVGSFLNVVIHRVPKGESLVRPPSACPSCGTPIANRDNIPVFGWLFLRGKCRTCRAPISPRYPLVELANAALWVAAVFRFDDLVDAIFVALVSSVLLALTAIDFDVQRLPNAIVYPSTVAAVVWIGAEAIVDGSADAAIRAAICGAAYFAIIFLIVLITAGRGMGVGDIKLAGFIGLATGRFAWEITVGAVMGSFLLGGLAAVFLLVIGRAGRKTKIAFGPWMAIAAVASLFAGPSPVRAWLGL